MKIKNYKRGYTPTPISSKTGVSSQSKRGYTIIETMISVSIFVIISSIGIGSLLNANLLHQKSQDMRSIIDGLSFIMEDMSRNLRTGYDYRCITVNNDLWLANVGTAKSGQGCWGIAFESTDGTSSSDDQWVYYIDNTTGKIFKSTQGPYDTFPSNYVQLSPNEVVIDLGSSSFSVSGALPPPSDNQQPFVTIRLVGTITYQNVITPFSLQTSVSQRLIDI